MWNLPLLFAGLGDLRLLFTEPGAAQAFSPAAPWQMLLGFPEYFNANASLVGWDFLPTGPWALVAAPLVGAPIIGLAVFGTLEFFVQPQCEHAPQLPPPAVGCCTFVGCRLGCRVCPVHPGLAYGRSAYTGPFVSFAMFAMLAAAANALAALRHEDQLRSVRKQAARPVMGLMAVFSVLTILASGSFLLGAQLNPAAESETLSAMNSAQQVRSSQPRTLPATAADAGRSEFQEASTLVLSPRSSGEIDSHLVVGSGETLDGISRYSLVKQLSVFAAWILNAMKHQPLRRSRARQWPCCFPDSVLDSRESLRDLGVGYIVLNETGESVPATVRTFGCGNGRGRRGCHRLDRTAVGCGVGLRSTEITPSARLCPHCLGKSATSTILPTQRGRSLNSDPGR